MFNHDLANVGLSPRVAHSSLDKDSEGSTTYISFTALALLLVLFVTEAVISIKI